MTWRDIARDDARAGVQSGDVWAVTGIFLLFTMFLGKFVSRESIIDGALSGTNAQTFLLVLGVRFVPVVGLFISVTSILRARESEEFDLSDSAARRDLLVGTFVGRAGVLSAAVLVGLLPSLVLFVTQSETIPIFGVFAFYLAAVLFGLFFVAVGVAISTLARERWQAIGGGVAAFVLLYAWPFLPGIVGLETPFAVLEQFWLVFLFGNLVDTLFSIRQAELTGSMLGLVVLAVFIAVPLAVGYARLGRTEA